MILASNSVKAFRVSVAPSEFISNVAEFGNPMFRLESLNPKESGAAEEKLPEGYTRVGWIAAGGYALLNTGYYPNHNSEILIDRSGLMDYSMGMFGCGSTYSSSGDGEGYAVMGIVYTEISMVICVFGAVSMEEQLMTIALPLPHEDVGWEPSGENPFEGYESEIAETRYSIYMSKDELSAGGVSIPNPATPASVDPWDIPFTLFGVSMGTDTQPMPDMIFSFKVSENGVPVVNMLPCIEDATGQPGFYDTVRNVFITGNGMFFTGDISEPKPEEPLPANLYLFNDCTHYSQVGEVYPDYLRRINDWNYYLNDLQIGGDEDGALFEKTDDSENTTLKTFSVDLPALTDGSTMFYNCTKLTSFEGDMPALTEGYAMFQDCTKLTSFTGDLSALTSGRGMFAGCTGLTSWDIELPNLTDVNHMFESCTRLTSFTGDLPKLTNGNYMFHNCTGLTSFEGNLSALTDVNHMFSGCTKLASFTGDLSALINGQQMFSNCTKLTSFTGDLSALTYGVSMFAGTDLTSWDIELPNLTNGSYMFSDCTGLTSFAGDLPKLTNGNYMFHNCTGLTSFNVDLSALTAGNYMFKSCTGLTSFNVDLSALTDSERMFDGCTGLTSFEGNLPALTDGYCMFYNTGLTSWDIELPNLTSGVGMFNFCPGLTSFNVDLPKLTNGAEMFGYSSSSCTKLDLASVQRMANTINDISEEESDGSIGWGYLYLGMDASLRGTEELETALAAIRAKGWTVTEMYRS